MVRWIEYPQLRSLPWLLWDDANQDAKLTGVRLASNLSVRKKILQVDMFFIYWLHLQSREFYFASHNISSENYSHHRSGLYDYAYS